MLERDADEVSGDRQGLAFFGEVFRMPFPQERYDQVFLPEFGGAMENYGCVSWSDDFLQRSAPTPAETELLVRILLHEMAHMWFGNIVTMRWWDDLWLNEAFAELAAHWAAERATSYTDVWAPTWPARSSRPTSPTRARPPTRSASRSSTSRRPPRSSTRSPTPRAPRSCSS